MALDTRTPQQPLEPSAAYVTVAREKWESFFDAFTDILEGHLVEIEAIGLDLGDQIRAEWVPLSGLTYDRAADTFYVFIEGIDRGLDYSIPHPREILVHLGATGVERIVLLDDDDHKHVITLREPLMLPEHVR